MSDGGPVFPGLDCTAAHGNTRFDGVLPNGEIAWSFHHPGMSLRDWFAGQVLMGLATSGKSDYEVAVACYELADEMIALSDERKRKERKRKKRKEANNE